MNNTEVAIAQTKTLRQDLDRTLTNLRCWSMPEYPGPRAPDAVVRKSLPRTHAIMRIQEAIMWLGMDLKAINDENPGAAPNPYPQSYDPTSSVIAPVSEGLKL